MTLELAILAPAVLALLGLIVAAGRVQLVTGVVEQAAAAAARAASLARDARGAEAAAGDVARRALAGQPPGCLDIDVEVDASGFAEPLGRPSSVSVEVACRVALADLAVPGLPGQREIAARMVSPLDSFRGRAW